jgi:hypothetical protein
MAFIDLNFTDIGPKKGFHPGFNRNLYGKIVLNLNLTGLCTENLFDHLPPPPRQNFWGKYGLRNNNLLQGVMF